MKIAIIGSRGLPADYGGFETLVNYLVKYLPHEKYDISVSCKYKKDKTLKEYNNAKLFYPPFKNPEHDFLKKIYELFSDFYFTIKMASANDITYVCGGGLGIGYLKFFKNKKSILNMAGLEFKRDKYNFLEKKLLKFKLLTEMLVVDVVLIDAIALKKYFPKKFQEKMVHIAYGADEIPEIDWDSSKVKSYIEKSNNPKIAIKQHNYWLVVARLQPSNNIHMIIQGYIKSNSTLPLIIIGDYSCNKYRNVISKLCKETKDRNIVMIGGVYDRNMINMFRQYCYAHIHGHSVGGTNPSLLEAMVSSNLILAQDNPFNNEVGGQSILYFKDDIELAKKMQLIEKKYPEFEYLKNSAHSRVLSIYYWKKIIMEYNALFDRFH